MTLALSWGLSIATGPQAAPCIVAIRPKPTQEERVRMTACCSHKFTLCILQGADKTFTLTDLATADYSTATEVTFNLYNAGSSVLSYSLTGGQITQPTDYQVSFTIPNADSTTLPTKRLDAEVWITFSDGSRIGAKGKMTVEDTRKHD